MNKHGLMAIIAQWHQHWDREVRNSSQIEVFYGFIEHLKFMNRATL